MDPHKPEATFHPRVVHDLRAKLRPFSGVLGLVPDACPAPPAPSLFVPIVSRRVSLLELPVSRPGPRWCLGLSPHGVTGVAHSPSGVLVCLPAVAPPVTPLVSRHVCWWCPGQCPGCGPGIPAVASLVSKLVSSLLPLGTRRVVAEGHVNLSFSRDVNLTAIERITVRPMKGASKTCCRRVERPSWPPLRRQMMTTL